MALRLLLLFVPFLLSCHKLGNGIQSEVLDCGESAREPGLWLKVLDPQGNELPDEEQLDARVLELNASGNLASSLSVSRKHCVNTRGASRIVIRSLAQGRSWSVLVREPAKLADRRVRLEDNSQAQVHLRCPEPWIHNGRFTLPLDIQSKSGSEAWALAATLENNEGKKSDQSFSLMNSEQILAWPDAWEDGVGVLTLRQKNFLQNPKSNLAELVESCEFTVDRTRPVLRVTPAAKNEEGLEAAPGSLVRLEIDDLHPARLEWCLQPYDQTLCDDSGTWQKAFREISLPMPEQGRWHIKVRAQDAAGNETEPLTQVVQIVRRDLIQSIATRVDQGLAEKTDQSWAASLSMLQALSDYRRLVIPEEQDLVRRKIIDGVVSIIPYLHEYHRVTLPGSIRGAWAMDESHGGGWLVLSSDELSLWSSEGIKLGSISAPFAYLADWSASDSAIALAGSDELWVIGLENLKFTEPVKQGWADLQHEDVPHALEWIPGRSQILLRSQYTDPAIVSRSHNKLELSQLLASEDTMDFAVSPTGTKFATVDGNQIVKIWSWVANRWELVDQKEYLISGFSFARYSNKERLMILLEDGRLVTWSEDLPWAEFDNGFAGETPTESSVGDFEELDFRPLQKWSGGKTGILERGGRFYEWSAEPNKGLQLLRINGFDWDELVRWRVDPCDKGVWLQDEKTLSYWGLDSDESRPTFKKLGEWTIAAPVDSSSFKVRCEPAGKRFLAMSNNRISFWSQKSPSLLVQEPKRIVVTTFAKIQDQLEVLFTAGFDGIIRLWDKSGRKLQEWSGTSSQVNEVRYLPEWNVYASISDSRTQLWKSNGELDGNLRLTGSTGAAIWSSALAFDSSFMLTAGRSIMAVWERTAHEKKLVTTIPLPQGFYTVSKSLVRLPGAPRILARYMRNGALRAFVVSPSGVILTESGLPKLENLKLIEWTSDGTHLAISDERLGPRIYRYNTGSWQEEVLRGPDGTGPDSSPFWRLSRFSFSPDGSRFAALRDGRYLVIGKRDSNVWSIALSSEIPLELAGYDKGPFWSPDSTRLVYTQSSQVVVRDREGTLLHRLQVFPGTETIYSVGLSQDPNLMAFGFENSVRIIDLNLDRLQTQLCTWLDAWIKGPDAPSEFAQLCTK